MSESLIHWPDYRSKRKASLAFAPLSVEASEKEIQSQGGARSLWAATAAALAGLCVARAAGEGRSSAAPIRVLPEG